MRGRAAVLFLSSIGPQHSISGPRQRDFYRKGRESFPKILRAAMFKTTFRLLQPL
jgi:hypothetical protein